MTQNCSADLTLILRLYIWGISLVHSDRMGFGSLALFIYLSLACYCFSFKVIIVRNLHAFVIMKKNHAYNLPLVSSFNKIKTNAY